MKTRYHKQLMCNVTHIAYDYSLHHGAIFVDEDNCVDMNAAIQLFLFIDPKVETIITVAGGIRDTLYRKLNGEWKAYSIYGH